MCTHLFRKLLHRESRFAGNEVISQSESGRLPLISASSSSVGISIVFRVASSLIFLKIKRAAAAAAAADHHYYLELFIMG